MAFWVYCRWTWPSCSLRKSGRRSLCRLADKKLTTIFLKLWEVTLHGHNAVCHFIMTTAKLLKIIHFLQNSLTTQVCAICSLSTRFRLLGTMCDPSMSTFRPGLSTSCQVLVSARAVFQIEFCQPGNQKLFTSCHVMVSASAALQLEFCQPGNQKFCSIWFWFLPGLSSR